MQTASHPWLDTSRAPVLVARLPASATDDEVRAYYAALEQYLFGQPRRYAFVTDARVAARATATQRRIAAEFERRTADYDKVWCAGVAIVADSPLARGLVTAVFWMAPPIYPYKVAASLSEALVWARAQLDAPR
ncbi:MAG: hypothetical protein R3A78_04470 [Polyangiales bacterium]